LNPYDSGDPLWPNYLESDAKCLPSLNMFAEHPWLQNAKKASNVPLGDIVRTRLKQFSVMNRFKKRALRVSIYFSLCIIFNSSSICIGSIRKFEGWWFVFLWTNATGNCRALICWRGRNHQRHVHIDGYWQRWQNNIRGTEGWVEEGWFTVGWAGD